MGRPSRPALSPSRLQTAFTAFGRRFSARRVFPQSFRFLRYADGMRGGCGTFAVLLLALSCTAGDLHTAVRAGDLVKVQALLSAGASANERDALGGTPLHDAAWSGELPLIEL